MMTFRNDYKIAFFDVDGTTVITSEGLVRRSAAEALRRLRETGVKLCIATGRPPIHTRIVSEAMDGADYKVCCNGCIVVDRQGNLDTVEVQVEMKPEMMSDTVKDMEALSAKLHASIAAHALVNAKVKLCQPGTLPRTDGKAKRVTDKRKL